MTSRICFESRNDILKTDVKDKKILEILSENSRIPLTRLAKKLRLSRDTVNYKVNRLKDNEVILRTYPTIDYRILGYEIYHMFIDIKETRPDACHDFLEAMKKHPNVLRIMEYSDQWDLEITLIAKNIYDFNKVASKISAEFHDIFIEKIKLLAIDNFFSIMFPYGYYKVRPETIPKLNRRTKADKKDMIILSMLSKDARTSAHDISQKVSLSPDAVRIRIKKMQERKIIKKFTILPNYSKLGFDWHTFVCQMRFLDEKSEQKLKEYISIHPHIVKATRCLGYFDLLIYIIARHPKEFHSTVKEIKSSFAKNLRSYASFIAYKEHHFEPFPTALRH